MKLTLYQIGRWAENEGLVGEKTTFLTGACAMITFKPLGFGIVSASGAGKSATMDLLVGDGYDNRKSLISSEYFYFKDAGSATSFWYDALYINSKKGMILKELQKDKTHDAVEMIKSITEGKSAVRKVTDVTEDEVKLQSIKPMFVGYSLAIENDMKRDAELERRCITVNTDVSKSQTEAVILKKAERLWDVESTQVMSEEESNQIMALVDTLVNIDLSIKNPFAPYFADVVGKIAPDQKTRSLMSHFWNVIEGVTKMNYFDTPIGFKDEKSGKQTTLVNIQDMWQAMDIYLDNFVRDIHGIPPMGDIILQGFHDAYKDLQSTVGKKKSSANLTQFTDDIPTSASITINEVRSAIKKHQNVTLKTKVVRDMCQELVDAGYLEDDRSEKVVKYITTDPFTRIERPDPEKMLADASAKVKEKYPEIYDDWYAKQRKAYTHPITGEKVELFKEQFDLPDLGEES